MSACRPRRANVKSSMRCAAACLLAAGFVWSVPPRTQAQTTPRTFLFFVDDLHLQFRSTPRLRDLIKRLAGSLPHDGNLWAMATTGFSSVSVAPTSDWTEFDTQVMRITGGGVGPDEFADPRQSAGAMAELPRRARVASAKALDAIRQAASSTRPTILLYFGDGYIDGLDTEWTAVTRAAAEADVPIYTIHSVSLISIVPTTARPAEWDAYAATTRNTLRAIAETTGGMTVFNPTDLDAMLTHVGAEQSPGR